MINPVLTIAIPTFDRNSCVEKSLRSLIPQLSSRVKIEIRDNASPVPVGDTLRLMVRDLSGIDIVRNPFNIGGNANFLRCLESCSTEWLWVLGDDDAPALDAVDRILSDVQNAEPNLLFINYRCELFERKEVRILEGTEQFLKEVDSLSNVLFLSAGVFRAPILQQHLRLAYAYSYSNMPQVIALMYALGDRGRIKLSMDQVCSWNASDFRNTWSVVNAALAFPTLLDLPLAQRQRKQLAKKLELDVNPELLGLARQLLLLARSDGDHANARWIWKQIRRRRFGGWSWTCKGTLAWLLESLFLAPRLTGPVVEVFANLFLGRRATRNVLQDRQSRI